MSDIAVKQRVPARTAEDRAEGPDSCVRCSFCDQGILPGEVWTNPRECCEEGRAADAAFMDREAKR